ncbi:putative membrane protein [Sphingomonas sp. F9_3S_D5_B_2]
MVEDTRAALNPSQSAATAHDAALWPLEGRVPYALAAAMLGVIWLASRNFINVWQPVADEFPARQMVVYAAGVAMVGSAAGLLLRRTAQVAAVIPTLLYLLFVWGWITRIMLLPTVFGTWSGCGEEIVLVVAGVLLITTDRQTLSPLRNVVMGSRVLFGICAVSFGIIHFDALEPTAKMVPGWIPGSGTFWAMATGAAHAAGGIALILNFRPRLAAQLLAAMYMVFDLLIWIPGVAANPRDPIAWGGTAVTLAMAASALVLADAIAATRRPSRDLAHAH